jgi:hypothetical protein
MNSNSIHCPDYTRDLTIRAMEEEKREDAKSKTKKGKKKSGDIHIL